ncbi:MAG TPA: Rrf2 family transcriptional regulator [Chloroflexota bacterium]|nr:Rrf2 family transcriptional regulator [Chloroflexota bacterium]HUM70587.1 Rrf2 family transcriptional regulator [Chloroflexota bacterium]
MSIFQINRRTDYALRIMIELAVQADVCLPVREISRRTSVPKAFLHKITADLVKAGLVQTQPGPGGGLLLSVPTEQINVQHILEAMDGPICLNICLLRPHECPRDQLCPGHDFWGRLQTILVQQLQATTLADLAAEAIQLRQQPRRRDHIPYLIPNQDIVVNTLPIMGGGA